MRMSRHKDVFLVPVMAGCSFIWSLSHNMTQLPPPIHLYQILQLSNHILSQCLIWQKHTLPRSSVVLRPSDPVQARGRDTTSGTWGREANSHECPAQEQPMSGQVWHSCWQTMGRPLGPGMKHHPITPSHSLLLHVFCNYILYTCNSHWRGTGPDKPFLFISFAQPYVNWCWNMSTQGQRMDKTISK